MTTPFADQLPQVHSMGRLLFDPVWAEQVHDTHCCELIHVMRGQVDIVLGRRRIAARPGDTLVLPARTPHRDDFDVATGLEVFMVFFSWAGEADFFKLVDLAALPHLPAAAKEAVARLVLRLRREFTRGPASDELLARVYLQDILLHLLAGALRHQPEAAGRTAERGEYGRQRRRWLCDQAKAYLEAHYQQPVALADIAQALKVSPYHLSHAFSAESEFSLYEFLTQLRMEKARALLEGGTLTVAEVAHAVGYERSSYFAKVFHRYSGLRPRELHSRGAELRRARRQ